MRIKAGVAVALWMLSARVTVQGQECELFQECMAGMCTNGQCVGVPLNSGPCDDFNDCTNNDTCFSGQCRGTPSAGGACDDFQECTTGDVCTALGDQVICMGATPAPVGTRCADGCGTCQALVPIPGAPLSCTPDAERLNGPCTPTQVESPCFVGVCQAFGVPGFQIANCSPSLKTCPNTDGNLCTGEFCDFETGECETAPLPVTQDCFPADCHRCVPETGACVPNRVGQSCDDFNECTGSTICSAEGGCVAGTAQSTATPTHTTGPGVNTPTPTSSTGIPTNTVSVNTATPTSTPGTPTATPTQGRCVGDCNSNGTVAVNELVTGVNIALDRADIGDCPQFDINSNGGAEVNELVSGVNSLLRGCVAAAAVAQ